MHKKVVVILSGCGVFDGAEIHEATLTLLALDRQGADVTIAAPDVEQAKVTNHVNGVNEANLTRNVLTESARIARGKISSLADLDPADFDAVIMPGGYGAALNLCDFGVKGAAMTVEPTVAGFLSRAFRQKKTIGAICIAPPIVAKVLADEGVRGARLTIGSDPESARAIVEMGQIHVECPADQCVVDAGNRIVTGPAYMLAGSISVLFVGIEAVVSELLAMA